MLFAMDARSRTFSRSTTALLGLPTIVEGGSGTRPRSSRVSHVESHLTNIRNLEHGSRCPLYPKCEHHSLDMRGPTQSR